MCKQGFHIAITKFSIILSMRNTIILFFLLGLAVTACDKERKVEVEAESLTENDLDICRERICPEITLNYIHVFGDAQIAESINKKIDSFIINSLSFKEDAVSSAKTIKEAATEFVTVYFEDRAQFPDMAGEYFAEISVNEIYNAPHHLCLELRQYLYTGGAHGYGTTSFLNLDPTTGEELSFDQLFKNRDEFVAFAEKKFRAQQKIASDESINNTGFWFEDEKFYLPPAAGFTPDSLIFIYNQYDIASYAEGPIELKISREEAKPFLRIK